MVEYLATWLMGAWAAVFLTKDPLSWRMWREDRGHFIGVLIVAFAPTIFTLAVIFAGPITH